MDKVNLFSVPYAGGSKHCYHRFVGCSPDWLNFIALEAPGRGARFKEKLLTDFELIVEDIYNQIYPQLSSRYVLYGHSMGALICYSLTKKLSEKQMPLPLHLFLSGCSAPSERFKEGIRSALPMDDLKGLLFQLGGIEMEILSDRKAMEFFAPILKSDFLATERFVYKETTPFQIPITCILGTDEEISEFQVQAWKNETTSSFDVYRLEGNHFFISNQYKAVMDIISKHLLATLERS